jgi:hypothetical protein
MATKTGFIVFSTKKDLSEIFEPLGSDTPGPNTGYIVFSSGKDLSQVFKPYVSGTKASNTGYKLADGVTDLRDVFVPKKMFELSTLPLFNGETYSGGIWGCTSANLGVGYCSAYLQSDSSSIVFKTIDYGANWTAITGLINGIRGITTNSNNTLLIVAIASGVNGARYSTNGGSTWLINVGVQVAQSIIMTRNNNSNVAIYSANNFNRYFRFNNGSGSSSYINTSNIIPNASIKSGSSSISDSLNVLLTVTSGSQVYRNTTNGTLSAADNLVGISLSNEDSTINLIGTCCNANNSYNFIVNRTNGTTGGRIYRSTSWNGEFTAVTNSPIALWKQIATSSTGDVVCAIADTLIYLSLDYGLNWINVSYNPTLLSSETFNFVTVSPDGKFITVCASGTAPTTAKLFYYTLP